MSNASRSSNDLKPCPFCGGNAEIRKGSSTKPYIRCNRCGCRTGSSRYRGNLAKAWNARADVTDEQFSLDVHNGEAWQVVRECRIEWRGQVFETESSIDCDGEYYCTACNDDLPSWAETAWDDYQAARFDGEPPFRCCPNCGAKVVA